jgi:hypothetical protein
MRSFSCALGVAVCLVGSRAEADVSKAMAAAKDNLPADTQVVVAIDVAAIYKSPLFQKAFDALKSVERDFGEGHALIKGACGWDPLSVIEGIVIGADPKNDVGMAFIQLSIDRTKATKCLESALAAISKDKGGKMTVKQDGNYTVASKGDGKRDSAYFPWVGSNVVAVSFKPDRKDKVDAWFGQKTFAKAAVAAMIGKLDGKAVFAGAYASADGKPLEATFMPITKAYGNFTAAGGKLSGSIVATATDAKAASALAGELTKELQKDMQRDRTPPTVKKIMGAIKIAAAGSELTISGATTEKDLGEALTETFTKKKKSDAAGQAEMAEALAAFQGFSKKMCACKDKACADKVNEEMAKWGTEMAKKATATSKPDPEMAKKMADVATKYTECMTKVMTPKQ